MGHTAPVDDAEERKRKEKGKAPVEEDGYGSDETFLLEEECSYESMSEGEAAAWDAANGYYGDYEDGPYDHEWDPVPVPPPKHAYPLQCRPRPVHREPEATEHVHPGAEAGRGISHETLKVLRVTVAAFVSATARQFDKMDGKRPVNPP